jgi:hypothetical protein
MKEDSIDSNPGEKDEVIVDSIDADHVAISIEKEVQTIEIDTGMYQKGSKTGLKNNLKDGSKDVGEAIVKGEYRLRIRYRVMNRIKVSYRVEAW